MMTAPASLQRASLARPQYVLAIVLLIAFVVEGVIMLVLARWGPQRRSSVPEALVDAILLTVLLGPVLWLVFVRPLRRVSIMRGELLGRLFQAQEQERARLARDLHDDLGQHLTAVLVGLRALEQVADIETAKERARAAAASAAAGLDRVRAISRGLRPAVLTDLGLCPALERLCVETRSAGASVALSTGIDEGARFDAAVEIGVFRIAQEAVTNSLRHAGAGAISMDLAQAGDMLELTVRDDGCGFDSRRQGSFGLESMRERAEQLGGRLEIRSSPGRGTIIRANLPALQS